MRLVLDDGYTLEGKTEESVANKVTGEPMFTGLPVINYRYRPALPDALAEWRYALNRATSGKMELDATTKFVSDHLVSWDVADARGNVIGLTADIVRRIPEPILDQLVKAIATWAPKAEGVAGNSPAG